ncbi:hypothetical protein AAY80_217 [Stenotrophomonas phage vB_SmaS-DLP_6]|nr:hypothetical protein AAY80_217 [Stenotrophomonas phage vB_SmaS-DLP_6]
MLQGKNHVKVRQAIAQMQCPDWEGVWIGGGVARSFYNNEPFKDVDMYFDSVARKIEWIVHMKSLGATEVVQGKQLLLDGFYYDCSLDIYANSAVGLQRYSDFTINTTFFTPSMQCTYIQEHVDDVRNRVLRLWKGYTPLNSTERAFKFMKLGYQPEDKTRFFADVHKLIKERA